jgi:hypothetical protein
MLYDFATYVPDGVGHATHVPTQMAFISLKSGGLARGQPQQ